MENTVIPMSSPKTKMLVLITLLMLAHISHAIPNPSFARKIPIYHSSHPKIVQEYEPLQNEGPPHKGSLSEFHSLFNIRMAMGLKPTSTVNLVFDIGSSLTWVQDSTCQVKHILCDEVQSQHELRVILRSDCSKGCILRWELVCL